MPTPIIIPTLEWPLNELLSAVTNTDSHEDVQRVWRQCMELDEK